MQSFRRLDVFQKTNQDIDSSSSIGGIFSILAFVVGLILFVNEYQEWNTFKNVRKLEVQSLQSAEIKATVDITLFGSPCYLISLDIADEVGNHISDYTDTIKKIRLDVANRPIEDNQLINQNQPPGYQGSEKELEDVMQMIKNKEQCRIIGYLFLKTVPGNFHISFHSKMELLAKLQNVDYQLYSQITVNHKINKLYFGEATTSNLIEQALGLKKSDSTAFDETRYNYEGKNDYDNYVKILPLNAQGVKELGVKESKTFRFAIYQQVVPKDLNSTPVIYFRYEVSPINIIYSRKRKSFYSFVIQLCAIIGGIFSVMGIFNSLTTNVIQSFKSK